MSCNHNCEECKEKCSESLRVPTNEYSKIKKIYGIVSGKGGVGKSLVTSLLACEMKRGKKTVAILDADITGPSIPKMFGKDERAKGTKEGIEPVETKSGIKIISSSFFLENKTDPIIWRGPVISGAIKQFWEETIWGDIDYMFVDMPPGTGDVPLTIFQMLPVDGIIIVTSPQELVSEIVEKGINMANKMNIPIVGIVENMSYFECPDCKKKHYIYGKSNIKEVAKKYNIKSISKIPINPIISKKSDNGTIEEINENYLKEITKSI